MDLVVVGWPRDAFQESFSSMGPGMPTRTAHRLWFDQGLRGQVMWVCMPAHDAQYAPEHGGRDAQPHADQH